MALAINEGANVIKEVRQVDFRPLAPPGGKGIETDEATCEFMCAFPNGDAVPAEFAFGQALATWAEFLDDACHKETADTAVERLGRVDK